MMKSVWDLRNHFSFCMHGLGEYKGLRQTNALEAFEKWYHKGVRVFEIDLARTDDGQYVAIAHHVDAPSLRRMEILERPPAYTADWFMRQKLFPYSTRGLTPLSLASVLELMRKYPDALFMLDTFGLFAKEEMEAFLSALDGLLATDSSIARRMLIETYNEAMVDAFASARYAYVVIDCVHHEHRSLSLDGLDEKLRYLRAKEIQFVSYPGKYANPEILSAFEKNNIVVFCRTKYNWAQKRKQKAGISVNIVTVMFAPWSSFYQFPLYLLTYGKRIVMKIFLVYKERRKKRFL